MHNNQAMNEAIRHVASRYLDGRKLTEGLRSLPVLRHARARQDAAARRVVRRRR